MWLFGRDWFKPREVEMKAALGYCSAVIESKAAGEVCLTIRLPVSVLLEARNVFRGRRVLVTLAGTDLDRAPDGVHSGKYAYRGAVVDAILTEYKERNDERK